MNRFVVISLLLAVAVSARNPILSHSKKALQYNTWVVLAAGSNGIGNYRHQADVCHAYHAIHDLGVPEEHIIVMMEDDIAYNAQNPVPGKIFNTPLQDKGPNVYEGVPHDYTHNLVSGENFLSILSGEEMTVGSRKSLKSGPEDNVFVYYSDHGNTDVIGFPHGSALHSADINDTIYKMREKNMFKKLIFYIEACLSGSMFYNLNLPENVYVATAAPIAASSYAACGGLCDAFSYLWITDMESSHTADYSFDDQFNYILAGMNSSQTCQYGDKELRKQSIADFFGPSFAVSKRTNVIPLEQSDLISNVDFEFVQAERIYKKNSTKDNLKELNKQIAIRKAVDAMGVAIISAAKPGVSFLATPPCKNCDDTCECIKKCEEEGDTEDLCKFECCDEESCYEQPPSSDVRFDEKQSCVLALSNELTESCHLYHPYLLSLEFKFHRVCKQHDVDVSKAVKEIRSQCASFLSKAF